MFHSSTGFCSLRARATIRSKTKGRAKMRYDPTYTSKCAIFGVILGSIAVPGIAATYNHSMMKSHGDWSSLYMYLGDERYGRAVVVEDDETFALNFPVGSCNSYEAVIYGDVDYSASTTATINLEHVRARIDRNPIHQLDGSLTTQKGENTLYLYFTTEEPVRFWNELRKGYTVRFEIKTASEGPSYSSFPLDGSAEALPRARSICKRESPESYFEDSPESQDGSGNDNHSDYF